MPKAFKIAGVAILILSTEYVLADNYYDINANLVEADNLLAVGKTTEAMFALEHVIALAPQSFDALKLKVKAHIALNEKDEAWKAFQVLKQHPVFKPTDLDLQSMESDIRYESQYFVGYRFSYESNLNSAPDINEIYLPVSDQTVGLSNSSKVSGARNMIYAGGIYDYRLGDDLNLRNSVNLLLSEDNIYNRFILNYKSGINFQRGEYSYGLGAGVSREYTESSADNFDVSLIGNISKQLSKDTVLSYRIGAKLIDYDHLDTYDQTFLVAGFNFRNAITQASKLTVNYEYWYSLDSNVGNSALIPEAMNSNASWDQAFSQHKISLQLKHTIDSSRMIRFNSQYIHRDYDHMDPGLERHRKDRKYLHQLELTQKFDKNLQLNSGINLTTNHSNYALVDYKKQGVYLAITKFF